MANKKRAAKLTDTALPASIKPVAPPAKMDEVQAPAAGPAFPIVGIGASAGGLEAFETFFRACPVDTGMAFVLIPHLDPLHKSLLCEILQRCTLMPVLESLDQARIAPNHIYIIPPNRGMTIVNGVLKLFEHAVARGRRMPIDDFLISLAEDQGGRSASFFPVPLPTARWVCSPFKARAVSAWCRNPAWPGTAACRKA